MIFGLFAANTSAAVTEIAAGTWHTCAVVDGRVKCWGENSKGQLGDGTTTMRLTPVSVLKVDGVTDTAESNRHLATGNFHGCAYGTAGLYCWGDNSKGQVGDGTAEDRATPVQIKPNMVRAVGAGSYHTCIDYGFDRVQCWGYNGTGQLGDGSVSNRNTPTPASLAAAPANLNPRLDGGYYDTCMLAVDGGVICWGANNHGQLGDGTSVASRTGVRPIPAGAGATMLAVGDSHACAVVNGGVQCWGANSWGQLGDGTTLERSTPVQVIPANSGVTAVDAGVRHTCAVVKGGVKCWGGNTLGSLGDGTNTSSLSPVQAIAEGGGVTGIAAGNDHSCAIVGSGVKCWGYNAAGQLGDGTTTNRTKPVDVVGLAGPSASADVVTNCVVNGSATLSAGGSATYLLTVSYADGTKKNTTSLRWRVCSKDALFGCDPSNTTAASIDAAGVLTASSSLTEDTPVVVSALCGNDSAGIPLGAVAKVTLQAAPTSSGQDCLFAWAEKNYPELFQPSGAASKTSGSYYYRYYSITNANLGVSSTDNHLYYLGSASRNALWDLGVWTTWASKAGCR